MKIRHIATLVVGASCLLSACDTQKSTEAADAPVVASAPAAASTVAVAAPAVVADAPITRDSPIWFEPEALSECAKDTKGVLHWNASSFPEVTTVNVVLPGADGTEGNFATSGTIGEKETGPWMRGGMEVIMRDAATGRELARAKVPSLPCEE